MLCIFLLSEKNKRNKYMVKSQSSHICLCAWWWRWKIWKKNFHIKSLKWKKKYNTQSFGQIKLTHFKNVLIVIGHIILHRPRVKDRTGQNCWTCYSRMKEGSTSNCGFCVYVFFSPFFCTKSQLRAVRFPPLLPKKKEAFPFQVKKT